MNSHFVQEVSVGFGLDILLANKSAINIIIPSFIDLLDDLS
jgi:hypothetical protein